MRALLVTGVLGAGTALVFALAALTATLFPNGTVVSQAWNGGWVERGGWGGGIAVPVPAPLPAFEVPAEIDPTLVDPGFAVEDEEFDALPGDTVGGAPDVVPEVPAVP